MGSSVRPDSTLSGLAQLIAGLGQLNDPRRKKREDLLEEIKRNPQLAQQLAQQLQQNPDAFKDLGKPRFGKNTADVEGFLKGVQIDPAAQFAQNEAKNMLGLQRNAMVAPANPALKAVGAPGVPTLSPEQQRQYDEYKSRVLGIPSQEASASRKASTRDTNLIADQREQQKQIDFEADAIVAGLPANAKKGLYRFTNPVVAKYFGIAPEQVMPSEKAAKLKASTKYGKQMEQEQQDIWASVADQRARELRSDNLDKQRQLREDVRIDRWQARIYERTRQMPDPNALRAALQNPAQLNAVQDLKREEVSPEQLPLWELAQANKEIRKQDLEKLILPAWKTVQASPIYKKVLGGQSRKVQKITEEDVQNLNQMILQTMSSVSGAEVPQFKLVGKGFFDGKDRAVYAGKDPEVAKALGIETSDVMFDSLSQEEKAKAFDAVHKKYPNETAEQIIARLKKGER